MARAVGLTARGGAFVKRLRTSVLAKADAAANLIGRRGAIGALVRTALLVAAIAGAAPVWLQNLRDRSGFGDVGIGGWRLAVAFGFAWILWGVGGRLADGLIEASFTSWWDPAKVPDGNLDWDDLRRLVKPELDPIENIGIHRPGTATHHAIRVLVVAVAVVLAARLTAELSALPALPRFLTLGGKDRLGSEALMNLSGNLTALLALLAAAASILFANSQLRSKVRADNRQEWLANARTLLGEVVALAREHAAADASARPELNKLLDPRRLRFELMLNPREKDHRLLMHLLRRLSFQHEPPRAEAADGGAFLGVLRKHCGGRKPVTTAGGVSKSFYDATWKDIVECDVPADLTTYVMRLGHVVLKREWERVKAAR